MTAPLGKVFAARRARAAHSDLRPRALASDLVPFKKRPEVFIAAGVADTPNRTGIRQQFVKPRARQTSLQLTDRIRRLRLRFTENQTQVRCRGPHHQPEEKMVS